METRAGLFWRPRATCTSIVSVDMDDEDGRCLLDVICDPQALNDFLHGSETHLDTDDLLDGSADPSSSFFSSTGGHMPEVQTSVQLSASVTTGVPSGSVDLDFLEDDDILGTSSPGVGGNGGLGPNSEPCDILQQSLAEANITEQSLQEAEAELDLGSFGLPGLTQVVQSLPDPSGASLGVGIGSAQIFPGVTPGSTPTPPGTVPDMIGPVLAHPGLQLQSQVMNKAISVQPFMQQVGLGNVTLQPISSLQTLPNGSQSGHLGIGQIQVVGQPTVMTINQSGQPILAKTMGGYQLHQPGTESGPSSTQARLGASVLSSAGGGGLLFQGGKATLGSSALNGAVVAVSSSSTSSSTGGGGTMTSSAGLLGFGSAPLGSSIAAQQKALNQAALMQNVIIQRTPTPIQPKPPQGGVIQPRAPATPSLQSDGGKGLGVPQGQVPVPVSTAQNVAFLTGKPSGNMVLSAQAAPQGTPFPQALFKQQVPHGAGKPLSVHVLNQSGSIVIPSQTVLQGQNHQFLLPQLQAGGQILTQHPGGHIITSQGPGGQLIANQILATNQNLNLSQMLNPQGHPHILSGHIQLQPGQIGGHPTLFQMPVSLAQTQTQGHPGAGQAQTVIQGMPIQNSLAMLSQLEGLGPTVSLQPTPQQQAGGIPGTASSSISIPTSSLSSSPSSSSSSSSSGAPVMALPPAQAQLSPGKLLLTSQAPGMILSHESLQMFLQQEQQQQQQQQRQTESASPHSGCVPASVIVSSSAAPAPSGRDGQTAEAWLGQSSTHPVGPTNKAAVVYQIPGHQQQQAKVLGTSPSHQLAPSLRQTESPQPLQPSPLILSQQIQSPHHQRPPSEPPPASQPSSRSCTPSALPSLFIIHNQTGGSPQHAAQTPQQPLSRPPSQPAPFQPDARPSSCSPKPVPAPPVQLQFQPQAPVLTLTPEQQHTLQLVSAQLQTLSAIAQPSPQQKQLQDRLHQVQHSIILQAKQLAQTQPQAQMQMQALTLTASQFSPQQEPPTAQIVTSSAGPSTSLLHQTSVLVKTPATAPSEVKVFPGAPSIAGATVKLGVTPASLAQSVQAKQGVPAPTQTQTATLKIPFAMQPSKEARLLEQLRKQQGSVLHPDYGSPFHSYGDALQRLIPYHLYQGTPTSLHDYHRVDEEFQSVSSQLLKRTRAMLDKYRLLLFEESKQRLGPSAEMVMIDRMFIQEEKTALNHDRVLATERPDEYAALQNASASAQRPLPAESAAVQAGASTAGVLTAATTPAPAPMPAPAPAHYMPTKLVIKQGGSGASVSWSTSSTPSPAKRVGAGSVGQAPPLSSSPAFSRPGAGGGGGDEDEDALPQRSSKPPMKTYEARRRIGLKLKIKQEAGFSKVVHNTALDPPRLTVPTTTIIRTPPRGGGGSSSDSSSAAAAPTTSACPAQRGVTPSATASSSLSSSSSSSLASSSAQINGTLEHHEAKRIPAPTPPPISCRLPLRKTYRANVSPPVRPGVAGGGAVSIPPPRPPGPHHPSPQPHGSPSPSPSPPGRTVIASVKVENRGGKGKAHGHTNTAGVPGGGGSTNAQGSPPGLMQELAQVEEVFYRGRIKNRHPPHRSGEEKGLEGGAEVEEREQGAGTGRARVGRGKNKERSSRAARQAPGPPSPTGSSCSWDSLLPAKRRKSDSPDMDNASFSSGSPPPDDSLNEHLQSAIDSILNLQQGATPTGRGQGSNPSHHRQAAPSTAPYRPPSSSATASQRLQAGGAAAGEFSSARGQNGKLVSRTHSR
ncbi:hypothetical protein AAFF_G00370300 [Aldrovandia affinis]|uniref:GLTSCR protein conserved domain-containing protein n=1 Tax=Aldrovandia affinis TaxID=143900 RepID=A0AAD7WMI0_9TELE|nr:hypothetical protein AAFF_G00370300 [Aldrovandia affinis]